MRGMIVAAGLGTRLRPLTDLCPKPSVPIRGVPLIAYGLAFLAHHGVDEIGINLHHLPDRLERDARDWCPAGVSLRFSRERELLDTGGGIRRMARFLRESEPAVVIGGDMLIDCDLGAMLESHRSSGAAVSILLRRDPRSDQFGTIGIDARGRVRRVAKRFDLGGEASCGLYTWVNLLAPRAFDAMPDRERFSHLDDWFVPALRRDPDWARATLVEPESCTWEPVGTPAEYLSVNFRPPRLAYFDGDAEARRRGVTLTADAVLGSGAEVGAGAELRRVVVWNGERVAPGARLRDAIVAGGKVHLVRDGARA